MFKITARPSFFISICAALLIIAALSYNIYRSKDNLLRSAQQETNAKGIYIQQKFNALVRQLDNLQHSTTLAETLKAKAHENTNPSTSGSILKQWEKRFGRVAKTVFTNSLTSGELDLIYEDGSLLGQVRCDKGTVIATPPKLLRQASFTENKQLFRQLTQQEASNKKGIEFLNTVFFEGLPAVQFGKAVKEKNETQENSRRAALILTTCTDSLVNPSSSYTSGLPVAEAVIDSKETILLETANSPELTIPSDVIAMTDSGQGGVVKAQGTYFITSNPIYPNKEEKNYYWFYLASTPQIALLGQALQSTPRVTGLLLGLLAIVAANLWMLWAQRKGVASKTLPEVIPAEIPPSIQEACAIAITRTEEEPIKGTIKEESIEKNPITFGTATNLFKRISRQTQKPFKIMRINIEDDYKSEDTEQEPAPQPTPTPEEPKSVSFPSNFTNSLNAIKEQAQPGPRTPIEKMNVTVNEIHQSTQAAATAVQKIHEALPTLHPLAFEAAMQAAQSTQNDVRASLIAKEFMALAQSSSQQHPELFQQIQGFAEKYQNGTALCEQVYACLEQLSNKVDRMDSLSRGMSTASEQQEYLIKEIQDLIEDLNILAEEGPNPEWEMQRSASKDSAFAFSDEYKEKLGSFLKDEAQIQAATSEDVPSMSPMPSLTPSFVQDIKQAQTDREEQEAVVPSIFTPQEPLFSKPGQTFVPRAKPSTPPISEEELAEQMNLQAEVLKEAIDSYTEFSRKTQ